MSMGEDVQIQPLASTPELLLSSDQPESPGPRTLINNIPATPDNFHLLNNFPKPFPSPSPTVQRSSSSSLLRKLRWANIGWYYHWGSKQYDFAQGKGDVHKEVRDVCKTAVGMVNWEQVFGSPADDTEWGEAGPEWKTWNETYGTPRLFRL